jgi:hypothetical protein
MSATSTATVSLLSIATDLGIHIAQIGVPMPTSAEFFNSERGLALAGTGAGIITTSVQGGVVSAQLDDLVARIPTESDKKQVKMMIASSVISSKVMVQTGVAVLYSIVVGRPMAELIDYGSRILVPQLFVHSLIATSLPMLIE